MKDAMFKHTASGGFYTVVAKVTTSFAGQASDMSQLGIRKTDFGFIAVKLPNIGLETMAHVQAATPIEDGVDCVLYRHTNGSLWLRPTAEFTDGRFEPMNNLAGCMMPAVWHLNGGRMSA